MPFRPCVAHARKGIGYSIRELISIAPSYTALHAVACVIEEPNPLLVQGTAELPDAIFHLTLICIQLGFPYTDFSL
jgi:hypothetical protein